MGVFSQAKPPLRRDNDEGYHLVRSPPHQEPHPLPSLRPPLVPQAAQVVRFVRLPRGEAPLVRVGPEGQAPPHHWHWPHAVPEGRLAPFQERLPPRLFPARTRQSSSPAPARPRKLYTPFCWLHLCLRCVWSGPRRDSKRVRCREDWARVRMLRRVCGTDGADESKRDPVWVETGSLLSL